MATTLIEVCARGGDTQRALATYDQMCCAPKHSKMEPSVHAYTAAMRAAAEGGHWRRGLQIWGDMEKAGCRPTGQRSPTLAVACAAQWHLPNGADSWRRSFKASAEGGASV